MKKTLLLALVLALFSANRMSADNETGFIEKFALAADREKVLAEMAPGTEEFFFFHALHYQNTKQTTKLAETMKAWREAFPNSGSPRDIIENREALLAYDTDPQRTLTWLREKLGLQFHHQQEVRDRKPDLPTSLDQARISRNVYLSKVLMYDNGLSGLSERELEQLVRDKASLRVEQVRALLSRITRPDVPGLVEMIAEDLKRENAPGFGAFGIHGKLLPVQLDQLVKLVPRLANEPAYVNTRLRKLAPGADEDAEFDPAVREAWLDRLWAYAKTLPPAFNSLKSTLLYRRLEHDRHKGVYDRERFTEYLRLPRQVHYLSPRWRDQLQQDGNTHWCDLNASFAEAKIPFPPIGTDEPLVRDYFLALFPSMVLDVKGNLENVMVPFFELVNADWLKPIFAEAMITSGKDKPERWASLLSPAAFQALKDRVDINFALDNKPFVTVGDDVAVDVRLKNVTKLIVRIYEINTLGFYQQNRRQLNTDMNLDGLVANTEETHSYDATPFLVSRKTFNFPGLKNKRGAWIIEFIGGGRSSRALVRTGSWHVVQRTGPVGDMLTVLDEKHEPVKDATVWLDGRKLTPEPKTGFIVVPFTANPGRRPIVLADKEGTFASLSEFEHHGEQHTLDAQFYLNREQLLSGGEATLAIRTGLLLGGAPQPLKLLKDAKLSITTSTLDGVNTTKEIKDLALDVDKVFTHKFSVPDRLASISVALTAAVEQISNNNTRVMLSAAQSWNINGIDSTELVRQGHFSKFGEDHVYELLGKNGEPLPDQQVVFRINRTGFPNPEHIALRTDEKGRINLGKLDGIASVNANTSGATDVAFAIIGDTRTRPGEINATSDATIEIPLTQDFSKASYALFDQREGDFIADISDRIKSSENSPRVLTIGELAPGDYQLFLREADDAAITIHVTKGVTRNGWVFGAKRYLEMRNLRPLNITNAAMENDSLVVRLANSNNFTRVHIAGSRFLPGGRVSDYLSRFTRPGAASEEPPQLPNLYSAGREIGDEYRYILERRFAKIFPGNMLTRPGLLLNPWELRTTGQNALAAALGEAARVTSGDRRGKARSAPEEKASAASLFESSSLAASSNIDFLATSAPVLLNLMPDKDGMVRIPRKALGDRQFIEIYAEDLNNAVQRQITLPEQPLKFRDLRLARSLEVTKPFTEKKQQTVLQSGGRLVIADVRTSEMENYDTVGGIFSLYTTLSGNPELAKFAWILEWPKLKDEEKRAKYSEFACHELSFFLSRKDPGFFAKVIKPYLANKKDKTFLDEYLLGADLHRYLEPWRYSRLNAAERALLGRRLPEETKNAARHLREMWELLTPNDAEQDRLFETALRGRAMEMALEGKDVAGLGDYKSANGLVVTGSSTLTLGGTLRAMKQNEAAKMPRYAAPPPDPAVNWFYELGAKEEMGRNAGKRKLERQRDANEMMQDKSFAAADPTAEKGGGQGLNSDEIDGKLMDATDLAGEALTSAVRAYYRQLGPVKEWAENNYWHLPIAQQGPELITVNAFWRDLAEWDGKGAFVSPNLAEAHRNFAEIMLALGVLDFPFEAPKHQTAADAEKMTITAGGPVVVYHKEILPAGKVQEGKAQPQQLLVSQAFFRNGDRYRMEGNLKFDKYITTEFLTGAVYGANLVVTNPSSAPADLDLLMQIPAGALPVLKTRATKSQHFLLQPYTTQTFEYYFYFPVVSENASRLFPHYPVNASIKGNAVAAAQPFSFNVVSKLTEVDKASWDYISQYGTDADALAFLEQNNIERLNLERAAWRCRKDVKFFRSMIALLQKRHHYDSVTYSYAVMHNEPAPMGEFLKHQEGFLGRCGAWLESKLINIDPVERRAYEHLEYSPLVNQRAHRLGAERRISTPEELAQYQKLMNILAHKGTFDAGDQMSVVYYLFLQDRVEEALVRFHQVNASALPTRLQHDYFKCYAAFYEGNITEARGIANQRAEEPVKRWRELFAEVSSQLDEIEGKGAKDGDKKNREKAQSALAATEPTFEIKAADRKLHLTWRNLGEVTVNYYLMDPEFAFSSSPFASGSAARFSIIKPNKSEKVTLPAGQDTMDNPLPAEYAKANVLIEVLGAGQRKTLAHHANNLKVTLAENYGRVEVRDSGTDKALPKTYVKVYARLSNGTVRFFKDGYTDLRGRFDYASLNSPANTNPVPLSRSGADMPSNGLDYQMLKPGELGNVEKLAILLLSDTNGAEVKEVSPPGE